VASGEKLLQKMRESRSGWKPNDLDRLYRYFGFNVREGGKHRVYWHPEFPQLIATVKRGNKLDKAYIRDAVELIDRLLELKGVKHS